METIRFITGCLLLRYISLPVTESLNKPSSLRLENNEYRGIVVAIHPDEDENPEIIDVIKEMFTNGSRYLYNATHRRAFFKEVTILIPQTWSDSKLYSSPGNATFSGADVVIAAYNPRFAPHGENSALPYTRQFEGCGKQALHIHMTSTFLLSQRYLQSVVGDYGRVLVHEWGHYRWGLFNEYPDERIDRVGVEYFYKSEVSGLWEPVSCSSGWRFAHIKYTSGDNEPMYTSCQFNEETGYEKDCITKPSPVQLPQVSGSIMHSYLTFPQVVNFCDNETSEWGYLHNAEAPTKQNIRCNHQSCWEVMRAHHDFNGNVNNVPRDIDDVTPTFHLVRAKTPRVILVLDTSGSMQTNERYLKLADAARTFIMSIAAEGTSVGIVDFDSDAAILSDLYEITSDESRVPLANLVPEDAEGGTCIGCGLESALSILSRFGEYGGSKIVLIADGEDGEADFTSTMVEKCVNNKVIIDTIAIGDSADKNMADLAARTGGRFYLQTDSQTSTGIWDAFGDSSYGETREYDRRVELQSVVKTFQVDEQRFRNSVHIDKTLGRSTIFDFSYFSSSGGASIDVVVTSPSGVMFDRSSTNVYFDHTNFRKVLIRINGIAERGSWEYIVQNLVTSEVHDVFVLISSYPSQEGVNPILVSSFLSNWENYIDDGKPLTAYVEVRQDFYPVIDAKVIATIERPSGEDPVELELLDNGAGADVTKDDGVYSRYFTQFAGKGFYGFKLSVVNHGEARILKPEHLKFSSIGEYFNPEKLLAGDLSDFDNISIALPGAPIPVISGVPAPNFTISKSGGAADIKEEPVGWDPTQDMMSPSKITDLIVTNTSISDGVVTITFTAPGDDFDFGMAHHYVIRWSNSSKQLREDLASCPTVLSEDVIEGNLSSPA